MAEIVALTDYYAFGAVARKYVNAGEGQEWGFHGMKRDAGVDSDDEDYTTEFRQYDSDLGIWGAPDAMMDMYADLSPYNFNFNDPVNYTDVLGLDPVTKTGPSGTVYTKTETGWVSDDVKVTGSKGGGSGGGILGAIVKVVKTVGQVLQKIAPYVKQASEVINKELEYLNKEASPEDAASVKAGIAWGLSVKKTPNNTDEKVTNRDVIIHTVLTTANDVAMVLLSGRGKGKRPRNSKIPDRGNVSPNVQKAIDDLNKILKEGGSIKPNKLETHQEINYTIKDATGNKMDLRVETHALPTSVGGKGDGTPQRHLNAGVRNPNNNPIKMKHINGGHKLLE